MHDRRLTGGFFSAPNGSAAIVSKRFHVHFAVEDLLERVSVKIVSGEQRGALLKS
jgi:hypothetical protein